MKTQNFHNVAQLTLFVTSQITQTYLLLLTNLILPIWVTNNTIIPTRLPKMTPSMADANLSPWIHIWGTKFSSKDIDMFCLLYRALFDCFFPVSTNISGFL